MQSGHETFAGAVDQDRALAAQGLGRQAARGRGRCRWRLDGTARIRRRRFSRRRARPWREPRHWPAADWWSRRRARRRRRSPAPRRGRKTNANSPSAPRAKTPKTRPDSTISSSATKFSRTTMEGVCRTAAISACMIAAPAPSPFTRTMRRAEWAASREGTRRPSASRSNGAPKLKRSSTRARASRATESAIASSTTPAPAATVSAACNSGLSPSLTAAATPPCAQTEDEPSPIGAAASTVTGNGASFRAQNRPASPPPTIRMSGSDICGFKTHIGCRQATGIADLISARSSARPSGGRAAPAADRSSPPRAG